VVKGTNVLIFGVLKQASIRHLLGWSICPDKGGQFRPEMGGQFAPDSLVNLLRIEVVKFIGFSTRH
jgi:hypothetical protein